MALREDSVPGITSSHMLVGPSTRQIGVGHLNEMVRTRTVGTIRDTGVSCWDLQGPVASPNRETEAMEGRLRRRSDWPLLHALLNTASGATGCSFIMAAVSDGVLSDSGNGYVLRGRRKRTGGIERVLWKRSGDRWSCVNAMLDTRSALE